MSFSWHQEWREDAWNSGRFENFPWQEMDLFPNWLTVHGFADEPATSEIISEDARLLTETSFRQNPLAAWEFYVWDSARAILILSDTYQVRVSPDWTLLEAFAILDE